MHPQADGAARPRRRLGRGLVASRSFTRSCIGSPEFVTSARAHELVEAMETQAAVPRNLRCFIGLLVPRVRIATTNHFHCDAVRRKRSTKCNPTLICRASYSRARLFGRCHKFLVGLIKPSQSDISSENPNSRRWWGPWQFQYAQLFLERFAAPLNNTCLPPQAAPSD